MRQALITYDLVPDAQAPDFRIINHGTVWTFEPLTVRAQDWWSDHVQNGPTFGNSQAVEHRYAEGIVAAIQEEGMTL